MAKSRLTPDYIEWVLKLNATEAAREMHKLNKGNNDLIIFAKLLFFIIFAR